jgi:hypothetical protein
VTENNFYQPDTSPHSPSLLGEGWGEVSDFPLKKEVIQPHLPIRLPCYDFTPFTSITLVVCLSCELAETTLGIPHSGGVTGGVYKVRERIHRGMLIHDY